jgi:uncharacterized protein YcbK (DUF882 family)
MKHHKHSRRTFLRNSAKLAIGGMMLPFAQKTLASAPASLPELPSDARSLAFKHTHTGERISLVYAIEDRYVPDALTALNRFLRDHYSGQIGSIDPQLFDLIHRLQLTLGCAEPFHVISGYRCQETNETLKNTRGGGVAKRSLHMDGKAIDLRLPGVPLTDVRDAALSLKRGGVGYYQHDQFVHIDTGRVRHW